MEIGKEDKWRAAALVAIFVFILALRWMLDHYRGGVIPLVVLALAVGIFLWFAPLLEKKGMLDISSLGLSGTKVGGMNLAVTGGKSDRNISIYRLTGHPMDGATWTAFLKYLAEYPRVHILELPTNELLRGHATYINSMVLDEKDHRKRQKMMLHADSQDEKTQSTSVVLLVVEGKPGQQPPQWPGLIIEPVTAEEYAGYWRDLP